MQHAVTTPDIVRLHREEALYWLRHGDKGVRDRAERTIESLRHHPNTELRRAGHLSNDKQTGETPRRLE